MKVKICGVCRPADARAAAAAGADYIGVIFVPGSRREQTPAAAAAIFAEAGSCTRVGVFADQPIDEVAQVALSLDLGVLQLHGREDAHYLTTLMERTGRRIWKAVWLSARADVERSLSVYGDHVAGLLLDARSGSLPGGSGTRFDWSLAGAARVLIPAPIDLIVAGGLTPENVKEAVASMHPDVVDVASGVEAAVGRKSVDALRAFVRNAKT